MQMGGVLKPNDGACHLDGSGMYQQSLIQDYPSLGHISRLVQDNAINLIFAVTEDVSSTYNEFSLRIPGSSVGKLAEDSENIVDIIRDKYQQISSSVELRPKVESSCAITLPVWALWFKREIDATNSKPAIASILLSTLK